MHNSRLRSEASHRKRGSTAHAKGASPRPKLRDFHRRLRRRADPGSPESARPQGPRVDRVVLPHARVAEDARPCRWRDGSRQRNCRARLCRNRCLDSRAQHVRSSPGPVAGRELEGLVGRGAAVSRAGLRAHASPAGAAQDGGRYGVSLCHRRHSLRGARATHVFLRKRA